MPTIDEVLQSLAREAGYAPQVSSPSTPYEGGNLSSSILTPPSASYGTRIGTGAVEDINAKIRARQESGQLQSSLQQQADIRKQGTVWTKDANGNWVATNDPTTRTAAGVVQPSPITTTGGTLTPSLSPIAATHNDLAKQVIEAPNDKKLELLRNYSGSVEAYKANIAGQALKTAEVAAGVPALEAEVKKMEAGYAYNYPKGQPDNDKDRQLYHTMKQTLQQAKHDAITSSHLALTSNPELASLEATSKMFIDEQYKLAFKHGELIDQVGPTAISNLGIVNPAMKDKTEAEKALYILHNKDPALNKANAVAEEPIKLLDLTSEGNPAASKLLAHQQAVRITGTDTGSAYEAQKKKASDELAIYQKNSRPENLTETMAKAGLSIEEQKAQKKSLDAKILAAGGLKSEEGMNLQRNAANYYAQQALDIENKDKFYRNINSWDSQTRQAIQTSPTLSPLLTQAEKIKGVGKVGFQDLLNQALAIGDPKIQQAALQDLSTQAGTAITEASKGVFGKAGSAADIDAMIYAGIKQSKADIAFKSTLPGQLASIRPYLENLVTPTASTIMKPGALTGGVVTQASEGLKSLSDFLATHTHPPEYWGRAEQHRVDQANELARLKQMYPTK